MDRQTLDMEGARRGEISAASLQMGDDTIAVQRIATMSVESMTFFPWDTPTNRRIKSIYATFFVMNLFFGMMALAWWGLRPQSPSGLIALFAGGALLLLAAALGLRAAVIALKLKKQVPYFRLVIGASDGRQIPLVDNNRDVLARIRDILRQKMDTGDRDIRGDFDLDLDLVNVHVPADPARPGAKPAALRGREETPPREAARPRQIEVEERDVLFDQPGDTAKTAS